jgi:uridine kinase
VRQKCGVHSFIHVLTMKKPFIIGITGGSGSGKTTFLKRIGEQFDKNQLCIISQDEYYRPREEQLYDNQGVQNFDLPTSIDDNAFAKDIKALLEGQTIQKEEYTFNNAAVTPQLLTFQPTPVIIVEGIFIFYYKQIADLLDFKLFIDARDDLKVIRRIKRDQNERNYPLEDVIYRYEHHVMPAYEKYTKPYIQAADVIINNHDNFENALEMVTSFIDKKVKA